VSDNITLPRAAEQVRKALELALESQFAPDDVECEHGMHYRDCSNNVCVMRDCKAALAALDAALAEPEKERAETVIPARCVAGSEKPASSRDESYRTTEPPAKPEPVHPGYVIGSHWLETAYSRIAAGEVEAEVLTEMLGARGWVKPEPATDEQVVEADENHEPSWIDYRDGWRAAERWHGITKEDKT
jgi:hypothetical protein